MATDEPTRESQPSAGAPGPEPADAAAADAGNPDDATEHGDTGDGSPSRRRLTRSRSERMIAGVAGGLAEYLDVDPVFMRIAFVVLLVVTGGLFGLFYLAAILVMPQGDATEGGLASARRAHRHEASPTAGVVIGVLLIAIGALALARTLNVPAPPWEAIFAVLLALTGLGIIADARHGVHGGLVALALLFTALAAITSAMPRVGIQTGFGDRAARPESVAALQSDYSHAFGSLVVDLRDVPFADGTTYVNVGMAFGDVTVLLPPAVAVRVTGETVFGSSQILGRSFDGVSVDHAVETVGYAGAARRVEIDLSNVFGSATVRQ